MENEGPIEKVELKVSYQDKNSEPLVFSSLKKKKIPDPEFLRKFMAKVNGEFLDIQGIFFADEAEKFRFLKNEKLKLEILDRKNELIDVESVLIFMHNSNTLFKQELDNLKTAMKRIAGTKKKKEEVDREFSRIMEVYSSDEFFSRIESKSS